MDHLCQLQGTPAAPGRGRGWHGSFAPSQTWGRKKADHLIPVKRVERARVWLVALFRQPVLATKKFLWQPTESLMIVTDASPQICGGVLLVRAKGGRRAEGPASLRVPSRHGVLGSWGSRSCRASPEALAIFLALKTWAKVIAGVPMGLGIRPDSTVALAIVEKASSSTPPSTRLRSRRSRCCSKC